METVDYTTKSTVLSGPRPTEISPRATSPPGASRVNVYNTSVGTVRVDMNVIGCSPGCRGRALLDIVYELPKIQAVSTRDVHHVKQRKNVELPDHLLDNRHPEL